MATRENLSIGQVVINIDSNELEELHEVLKLLSGRNKWIDMLIDLLEPDGANGRYTV